MSMSTSVYGFKPADDKWQKMRDTWHACEAAGVPVPREVLDFFNHEPPDARGVRMDLEEHACCSEYNADMVNGFEIDVSKLPADVRIIRFVNSF